MLTITKRVQQKTKNFIIIVPIDVAGRIRPDDLVFETPGLNNKGEKQGQ